MVCLNGECGPGAVHGLGWCQRCPWHHSVCSVYAIVLASHTCVSATVGCSSIPRSASKSAIVVFSRSSVAPGAVEVGPPSPPLLLHGRSCRALRCHGHPGVAWCMQERLEAVALTTRRVIATSGACPLPNGLQEAIFGMDARPWGMQAGCKVPTIMMLLNHRRQTPP